MEEEKIIENKQETKKEKKKHIFLKSILIILVVFLLFVIIISTSYYVLLQKRTKEITNSNAQATIKEEKIVEYGTTLNYEEIIENVVLANKLAKNTNIKIWINDTLIEQQYAFEIVGNVTIKVELSTPILPFSLNEKISEFSSQFLKQEIILDEQIYWTVQDTKMPKLFGVQDKEITEGDEIDIKAGITATDEVDGELEVTVEGEFDANKVGEYTLTAKAVDKNQNETVQTFKITVKQKPAQVTNPSTTKKPSSSANSNNSGSSNSSGNSNSSTNSNQTSSSTPSASTKEGRLALAKAEAKRVVSKIITSSMSNLQKATAICNYITTTVDVQYDQSSEAYKTNYGNEAYAALIMKIAACSGRCKAVTLLCDAAGLKSQHINQNQWTHQWNKIQMEDGSWIVIDSQIGFVGESHPLE